MNGPIPQVSTLQLSRLKEAGAEWQWLNRGHSQHQGIQAMVQRGWVKAADQVWRVDKAEPPVGRIWVQLGSLYNVTIHTAGWTYVMRNGVSDRDSRDNWRVGGFKGHLVYLCFLRLWKHSILLPPPQVHSLICEEKTGNHKWWRCDHTSRGGADASST